jgi:hypothetical protein
VPARHGGSIHDTPGGPPQVAITQAPRPQTAVIGARDGELRLYVFEVGGHPCERPHGGLVLAVADTGCDLSPDLLDVVLDRLVCTPSFSRQLEEPTVCASEPCAADELVDKLAEPLRIVTLEQPERRLELPEHQGRGGDRVQQLPASSRQAVRGELFLEGVLDQPVEVLEPVADRRDCGSN